MECVLFGSVVPSQGRLTVKPPVDVVAKLARVASADALLLAVIRNLRL